MTAIRQERCRFEQELKKIGGIHAIPSQANYIMIEITNGMSARELTKKLLFQHNLFVKDLSAKIIGTDRQFLRIAVRNTEDNDKLVRALKHEIEK